MSRINNIFSVYIDVVMLCIGLYMAFVQGTNLIQVEHMERESRIVKVMGWIYIVVSIIGFIILAIF
nr:CLC_0170 family protein [uncultured Cellulosilyticum sp.]